jgi:hypothetical protein
MQQSEDAMSNRRRDRHAADIAANLTDKEAEADNGNERARSLVLYVSMARA